MANEAAMAADEDEVILAPSSRRLFREGEAKLLLPSEVSGHINVAGCGRKAFAGGNGCNGCKGGRLLVRRMGVWQEGIPDPHLISGFKNTGVRLYESVLEGEADLGPSEQSVVALLGG